MRGAQRVKRTDEEETVVELTIGAPPPLVAVDLRLRSRQRPKGRQPGGPTAQRLRCYRRESYARLFAGVRPAARRQEAACRLRLSAAAAVAEKTNCEAG